MKILAAVIVTALATAGGAISAGRPSAVSPPGKALARACANAVVDARLKISAAGFALAADALNMEHLAQAVTDAVQGDASAAVAEEHSVDVQGSVKQLRYFTGSGSGSAIGSFNASAATCWRWASAAG